MKVPHEKVFRKNLEEYLRNLKREKIFNNLQEILETLPSNFWKMLTKVSKRICKTVLIQNMNVIFEKLSRNVGVVWKLLKISEKLCNRTENMKNYFRKMSRNFEVGNLSATVKKLSRNIGKILREIRKDLKKL